MNKKRILIIVAIIVIIGIAYVFFTSGSNSNPEVAATPTPIAEESLYITFDGNGGYTVLDTKSPQPLPQNIQEQIDDNNVKKQSISLFPDIITLIGDYEATTLSEISSKPDHSCVFSCIEVLPEVDELTGYPKTSKNILFFETTGGTPSHLYKGVTDGWLLSLKKDAFFYHLVSNENDLPVETKNTLTYAKRLFDDCLETKMVETAHKVYNIKGEPNTVYRISYNFNFNNNIVTIANSYIVKVGERYLEVCNELPDLSKFLPDIDITAGFRASKSPTSEDPESVNKTEETTGASGTLENTKSVAEDLNVIPTTQYTTYAEFLKVVAPELASSLKEYLDSFEAQPDVGTKLNDILIGDYHALDYVKQRNPVLNAGTDNGISSESADNAALATDESDEESNSESEDGFFKKLLNKIPFLNKNKDNPNEESDASDSTETNTNSPASDTIK